MEVDVLEFSEAFYCVWNPTRAKGAIQLHNKSRSPAAVAAVVSQLLLEAAGLQILELLYALAAARYNRVCVSD